MVRVCHGRREFVEALVAVPFGAVALSAQTSNPPVMRVAAGSGRANDVIKLPGGDLIHVKVATQDSGGALFMTEQPIERRGSRSRSPLLTVSAAVQHSRCHTAGVPAPCPPPCRCRSTRPAFGGHEKTVRCAGPV